MKKVKSIVCGTILAVSMLSMTALAADFSFFFVNTGTDYSALAPKSGSRTFATVSVATAPSTATYKYSVARGIFTNYITGWKNNTGTGTFDVSYTTQPSSGESLRLHGATVSSSGTSTVSGTWIP